MGSSKYIVDTLRIDDLRIDDQSSMLRSSIYTVTEFRKRLVTPPLSWEHIICRLIGASYSTFSDFHSCKYFLPQDIFSVSNTHWSWKRKNQMNWIIIKRKDGDERVRGYLHSRWARALQTFARTKYNFDGGMFLLLRKYFSNLNHHNTFAERNIKHLTKIMQILFRSLLNTYPQCLCLWIFWI